MKGVVKSCSVIAPIHTQSVTLSLSDTSSGPLVTPCVEITMAALREGADAAHKKNRPDVFAVIAAAQHETARDGFGVIEIGFARLKPADARGRAVADEAREHGMVAVKQQRQRTKKNVLLMIESGTGAMETVAIGAKKPLAQGRKALAF